MGLGLVKKELEEAANDIRASVRSFVIKRKTRKLEFELRDIPMLLDLPKLSLAATTPNIIPYLSGEQLALAMGTCKAFYNTVCNSPELMQRVASRQELNRYLLWVSPCARLTKEDLRILAQRNGPTWLDDIIARLERSRRLNANT
jgi:RNA-splicing ligase RtcB